MSPNTCEAFRDILAGSLAIGTQTAGIGISTFNLIRSLFKKSRKRTYDNILITGASDGIGKALAEKFASEKKCNLILVGRTLEKLDQVARTCAGKGSHVKTFVADFANPNDLSAFAKFVKSRDEETPLDCIIANAAMTGQTATNSINVINTEVTNETFYNAIIDTNVKGILATFMPVLDNMIARKSGHIVLVSSINAYMGPATQFLYSSTKSFIKTLGEDLAQNVKKNNVLVSVVAPGIVHTNMTHSFWNGENSTFPESLAQNPTTFAEKVYKCIIRGDSFITYPYYQFLQTYLSGTLPPSVRAVISNLYTKTGITGSRVT